MIISDEQVQRALDYLHTPTAHEADVPTCTVSEDLVARVRQALQELPETREERVNEAKERLQGDPPSADDVAAKIIGRVISDSLR
jgi:predicted neutral ceramidase superfamily lipid hydrolase